MDFVCADDGLDCPDGSDELCDDSCAPDSFTGKYTMKVGAMSRGAAPDLWGTKTPSALIPDFGLCCRLCFASFVRFFHFVARKVTPWSALDGCPYPSPGCTSGCGGEPYSCEKVLCFPSHFFAEMSGRYISVYSSHLVL